MRDVPVNELLPPEALAWQARLDEDFPDGIALEPQLPGRPQADWPVFYTAGAHVIGWTSARRPEIVLLDFAVLKDFPITVDRYETVQASKGAPRVVRVSDGDQVYGFSSWIPESRRLGFRADRPLQRAEYLGLVFDVAGDVAAPSAPVEPLTRLSARRYRGAA